jgi:hypothetical protein
MGNALGLTQMTGLHLHRGEDRIIGAAATSYRHSFLLDVAVDVISKWTGAFV